MKSYINLYNEIVFVRPLKKFSSTHLELEHVETAMKGSEQKTQQQTINFNSVSPYQISLPHWRTLLPDRSSSPSPSPRDTNR